RANYYGLINVGRMNVLHHEDAREQRDRQDDVHRRPGDGDHEALPARMRHEFGGIAGTVVERIFAAHLDVAAKRQHVDAVVGFAAAESPQPLAETDGELLHAHAEEFGGSKVAKFVDQHHDAEHHDDRDQTH